MINRVNHSDRRAQLIYEHTGQWPFVFLTKPMVFLCIGTMIMCLAMVIISCVLYKQERTKVMALQIWAVSKGYAEIAPDEPLGVRFK